MTNGNGGDLGDMSMMDLFRMEAENQCNQLSEDLIALEQDPNAANLLESLMRASHSVKGAARVVELHPAVQVAHAMEDVFVAAQESKITLDQEGIDLMLQGVDMLNSISQLSDDDTDSFFADNEDKIAALVSSFTALAKGEKTSTKDPAASTDETPSTPESAPSAPEIESTQLPVDLSDMSMLDLFRMEAENHCTRLSEDLIALENDPASSELLESMMRASHSMKGAARIVELHAAVKLAHAMEDVFVAAQLDKITIERSDIDILLKGVDLLTTIAQTPETEAEKWFAEHTSDIDDLVKKFEGLAKKEKSAKPEPTPEELPQKISVPEPSAPAQKIAEEKPPKQATQKDEKKKQARRKEDKDGLRAVRVSAQNMDRMMGLAGESLIESRWLPTFNKELLRLKYRQDDLYETIDKIRENLHIVKSDELTMSLFSDLQDRLELCRSMLIQDMEVLEDHARNSTSISNRLYTEIITSKMRPFSEGIRGFARMVRDVARELGKDVNFEVIGSDTMVDRDILDKIEAPLNHMIRNALDHGIELPADRSAKGKPEKGTIQLIARHSAGMLSITVKDDGKGVDLEKLRQTVVEKKLCTSDMAADLSEHELLEFLFLPNFSTKKSVSKVSGRGVGMDVVHSVINEVRGKIRSSTKLDEGSSFELQLPLTLSVLRALLTEINSEPYAFPLVSIDHVLQLAPEQIQEVEGRQYFTFNEKRIGVVSAQQVFKTETPTDASEEHIYVIVFSDRLNLYGLTVDKLLGVRDLVVQRIDPRLGKVKDINSASILEDGTPVLIIDVEDVFRSLDQLISGNRLMRIGREDEIERRIKRILVADDSITVREVERKMLVAQGYEVDVAVDGMDAWNTVRENEYDLLISDIDMPRMNGFELVALIKNDPALRNLPVIIVSYKDREEDRNKGLEVGADYYLTKGSFQDKALVNAVLDLIGEAEE
ncbi:MAG: hybrid sensor histidine kinase/response regulator [Deltaproteobacteria bacterium]|nr:MAG: hybrid sensor histidine kinase/response regulator [Deltaproteobacteria bacterium]